MTKTAPPYIRWMIRRDMPEVVEINRLSGGQWDEEAFLSCLRARDGIGVVSENRDLKVTGFMIYLLGKTHIRPLNLAVRPEHRRIGVGSTMIEKLKRKLGVHRRRYCSVTVRETNYPLLCLLRKHKFVATKLLPDLFPGCDGITMTYENPEYEDFR